jgi:hypothetical protein
MLRLDHDLVLTVFLENDGWRGLEDEGASVENGGPNFAQGLERHGVYLDLADFDWSDEGRIEV